MSPVNVPAEATPYGLRSMICLLLQHPHSCSVTLKPKSAASARVRLDGLRLDGDDYGHSEPTSLNHPGQQ